MYQQHSYCSYCGCAFWSQSFPKNCLKCANITYSNPLPVVNTIVRVWKDLSATDFGFLLIKRNIEPSKGTWAFPGGFIDQNETFQQAAAREVKEETGLIIDPSGIDLFDVKTAKNGNILIFNTTHRLSVYESDIKFIPNDEVSDIDIVYHPIELGFPTHTEVFKNYWEQLSKAF